MAEQAGPVTVKQTLERMKVAITLADNWKTAWQDCYDYAIPGRTGFDIAVPGQSNTDKIFDSTPVHATQDFASRMQAGIAPPFLRWFGLQAGSEVPKDQKQEINEQLDEIAEFVWEVFQNSNLNAELHESFIDLAVGTGSLLVEEGDDQQPVVFTAIPQTQLFLDEGPHGGIDGVFRLRSKTLAQIKTIWPEANITTDMESKGQQKEDGREKQFKIAECVFRDWNHRATEKYIFQLIAVDEKHMMQEATFSGDGSNPWVAFRWSKTAGEVYGRGPLFNALPDIKTLNLTTELTLENAEMAVTGMWQGDDDGVLNPDTIELQPGIIIPRAVGSSGLAPLESPARFDVANLIIENMQFAIKKALFNEALGRPEGTPMSATEVAERMADLARVIGSAHGRLMQELIIPIVRRAIFILKKQGKIEIPRVNGREIKVISTSPLAHAQNSEDAAKVARWMELMNGAFGPQVSNVVADAEKVAKYWGEKLDVPEKLVRDAVEQEQLQQAILDTQAEPQQAAA